MLHHPNPGITSKIWLAVGDLQCQGQRAISKVQAQMLCTTYENLDPHFKIVSFWVAHLAIAPKQHRLNHIFLQIWSSFHIWQFQLNPEGLPHPPPKTEPPLMSTYGLQAGRPRWPNF